MTSSLRVLHLSSSSMLGGAERSLLELAAALHARHGFAPRVILPGAGALSQALETRGLRWDAAPLPRFRRTLRPMRLWRMHQHFHEAALHLADVVCHWRPHVVHGNTDEAFAVIARMRRRHRAALPPHAAVWHCRDFRPLWGFGRRFASQADSIIAVSDAVRAHLARQRVPRANVIHNGVALNELLQGDEWLKARRDVRRELHLPDDALVIGSAGSFVAWKQHDLFIRLVHALPERVKGCPVVGLLCGDDLWGAGTLKRSLERAAGSRVRLTGWREDMPRVYPAMDVFVSAADEPFGRVFVEAQASGLPVVAADRGGAAEIIVDRQTGCLVRPELDSFLDATRGLLAEPAQRRAFGEAGRRRMLAHFDISRCADAFAKHVKQLAGRYGCRGDAEDD